MASSRKNKQLYIDAEALSSMALVQEGLIAPVTKLMTQAEAIEVRASKMYKGVPFPFPFILAPKGKQNETTHKLVEKGEIIDLMHERNIVGQLTVEETFTINPSDRLKCIYGTADESHPGVKNTIKRLGHIAVAGIYTVYYPLFSSA